MAISDDGHDDGTEDLEVGRSRRSFLRWGALGAAAYTVATIAEPGEADAVNGSNFVIGVSTNTASATTELNGGSSLAVIDGNSYIVAPGGTPIHAAVAGEQTEDGSIAVYGKDTSTSGAVGVQGDGLTGVLGQAASTGNGSVGVKGTAADPADTGIVATNTAAGLALDASSAGGAAAYLHSTSGPALHLGSQTGPAVQIDATTLTTVPPKTGTWRAGQILMKHGVLWCCVKGGVGTASHWAPISRALVTLPQPKRAYDSRKTGGRLAAGHPRTITVARTATGVPVGASAALLSVTALRTGPAGSLTVYSASAKLPATRNLSWWGRRQTHTTTTTSRLSSTGKIKVRATAPAHILVDVLGYYF